MCRCMLLRGVIILFSASLLPVAVSAQPANLIRSGDFSNLADWQPNATLRQYGTYTRLPDRPGVMIENPQYTLDGALEQTITVKAGQWYEVSMRAQRERGGVSAAALALVALDAAGQELRTINPFRMDYYGACTWEDDFRRAISFPEGTRTARVMLTVLKGQCAFADVRLTAIDQPPVEERGPRMQLLANQGFSVERMTTERPLWELHVDDLDGDGTPELITCDVDGRVTVRREGQEPFLQFDPGALVYQFVTADLTGDGRKEILISTVSPEIPIRAIDLQGHVVTTFPEVAGDRRMAAADMDGDGRPEVAIEYPPLEGVALFTAEGRLLWKTEYPTADFQFGDMDTAPGRELAVSYGRSRTRYAVYEKSGSQLAEYKLPDDRPNKVMFSQVADINSDGRDEIVMYRGDDALLCFQGETLLWQNTLPSQLFGDIGLLRTADFYSGLPGLETAVVGTHYVFLLDAKGTIVYSSSNAVMPEDEYRQSWNPRQIGSISISFWNARVPELYLCSSAMRDPAYYRLRFGGSDQFGAYRLPDHEAHLDTLYQTLKAQPALPSRSKEKFKVVLVTGGRATRQGLADLRRTFDRLESPNLEYLVMYGAGDLKSHPRGGNITLEQITERARMFEELKIPFGYFTTHGLQVWTSDEAIYASKKAAPTMFRFIYLAEDLEMFYGPMTETFLDYCDRMMEWCSRNNMKVLFKDKHDVWGVLPSDPAVAAKLFKPAYRDVIVPLNSTNQVYQPEVQLGGLLGLQRAGWCTEWGMSTQFWNYGEWGRYNADEVRDLNGAFVCPSDVILRLELLGGLLGGTWLHIEGGQVYLNDDPAKGLHPMAPRHRDLVYELVRKNILTPFAPVANVNTVSVSRAIHPAFTGDRILYPYYTRNTPALRKGFIPARHIFEPYLPSAFPRLAYHSAWNAVTCFPETPFGWIPVIPPSARMPGTTELLETDGERIQIQGAWQDAETAARDVRGMLVNGAQDLPVHAPGTCVVVHGPMDTNPLRYRVFLLDPGYLGPTGVSTVLRLPAAARIRVTDMITGKNLPAIANTCRVQVPCGAFTVVDVTVVE